MRLPEFMCIAPSSTEEACTVLQQYAGRIVRLAGGTDLVLHLKHRLLSPTYVLSMRNLLKLKAVRLDEGQDLVIGSMCTLADTAASTHVRAMFQGLAEAAESVGSPQIRNRGTIGGNVCLDTRCWYYNRSKQWRSSFPPCFKLGGDRCHVVKGAKHCFAIFQADTVPNLLVMNARVKLVKKNLERVVPLEEFYTGRGELPNRLGADEILTEILVPRPSSFSGSAYIKYRRRHSIDFPIIGTASMVRLDREGKRCMEAKFAFSGIGMAPYLVDATDLLSGLDNPGLDEDRLESITKNVKPVSHMGMRASLKRRFAHVLVQKTFDEAWKRARQEHDTGSGRIS